MSRFYGQMTIVGLFIVNLVLAYNLGDKGSFWLYFILFCILEFIAFVIIAVTEGKKGSQKEHKETKEELADGAIHNSKDAWTKLVEKYKKEDKK